MPSKEAQPEASVAPAKTAKAKPEKKPKAEPAAKK